MKCIFRKAREAKCLDMFLKKSNYLDEKFSIRRIKRQKFHIAIACNGLLKLQMLYESKEMRLSVAFITKRDVWILCLFSLIYHTFDFIEVLYL